MQCVNVLDTKIKRRQMTTKKTLSLNKVCFSYRNVQNLHYIPNTMDTV